MRYNKVEPLGNAEKEELDQEEMNVQLKLLYAWNQFYKKRVEALTIFLSFASFII